MEGLEGRSNTIFDERKAANELLALTFLAANVSNSFQHHISEIRDAVINLQMGYIYMSFLYPIKISRWHEIKLSKRQQKHTVTLISCESWRTLLQTS